MLVLSILSYQSSCSRQGVFDQNKVSAYYWETRSGCENIIQPQLSATPRQIVLSINSLELSHVNDRALAVYIIASITICLYCAIPLWLFMNHFIEIRWPLPHWCCMQSWSNSPHLHTDQKLSTMWWGEGITHQYWPISNNLTLICIQRHCAKCIYVVDIRFCLYQATESQAIYSHKLQKKHVSSGKQHHRYSLELARLA